jgi:hypothetical protein
MIGGRREVRDRLLDELRPDRVLAVVSGGDHASAARPTARFSASTRGSIRPATIRGSGRGRCCSDYYLAEKNRLVFE